MGEEYNGWTNYETWNVKLWMDDAEAEYHYWEEQTRAAASVESLAKTLETYYDENIPEEIIGTYLDLLTTALQAVNWQEIAKSLWEEWRDEESAEEKDAAV